MDNPNENSSNREVPVSQIVIRFPAPGYAECEISVENVTALQAIAAAWMLSKQAEVGFMQMEMTKQERQRANAIAVPKAHIVGNRHAGSDEILKAK